MKRHSIPIANTSPQAVALRKAAMAFTHHANAPIDTIDQDDLVGLRLNRQLLEAAVSYAKVAICAKSDALLERLLAKEVPIR